MPVSTDFKPFVLHEPLSSTLPLLCDSPHSGIIYPADFNVALAMPLLRQGEDTYVDELWQALPQFGASLLEANFHRTYIDPNRDENDIDSALFASGEKWPHPLQPTVKTEIGYGLIWKKVRGAEIYNRALTVAEVQSRIENYYRPYHQALADRASALYEQFGALWHVNLHSMPSDAYVGLGLADKPLADFVLGDRDGTTCDEGFIACIEQFLLEEGYSVARNDPYKGVALIERMGQPAQNKHSIQVEINRTLYMNEITFEKNAGFVRLQRSLAGLSKAIADYVQSQL